MKMTKEELIQWINEIPLQTLTNELKDEIIEKIEELTDERL